MPLLSEAISLLRDEPSVLASFRHRNRSLYVDEAQDMNPLQFMLLRQMAGDNPDLFCVGDPNQSIYGFTGASAEHLLSLPRRFPHALVVRLEENYRSTPQILALANRLVPKLGGAEKTLRAVRSEGLEPELVYCEDEGRHIVERIRALGIPHEEIAILCRTNARLADFEEALHSAEIPYQGSSLLERNGARQLLRRLRDLADVRSVAHELGWLPELPEGLGEREETRQRDLGRLVTLAESFDGDAQAFRALLEARYGRSAGEGVHLLTLHRAKGLEFEAVFVPRVEEQELPLRRCDEVEERRLLYVGLTRAKRHLTVTWTGKPSRFLRG